MYYHGFGHVPPFNPLNIIVHIPEEAYAYIEERALAVSQHHPELPSALIDLACNIIAEEVMERCKPRIELG